MFLFPLVVFQGDAVVLWRHKANDHHGARRRRVKHGACRPEAKVARPGWYPTELYDLEADLGETKNVGGKHPDVVKRLVALLERHREDIRKNSRPPARVPAR